MVEMEEPEGEKVYKYIGLLGYWVIGILGYWGIRLMDKSPN